MVKGTFVFLLFTIICAPAFAYEDKVDLANIDKNLRLEIQEKVAKPAVIEKYEYYEIRGNDEKELRRQMSQNGTKWDDGKTYDAVTSWSWKWDYDYIRTSQGCFPDSLTTTVNVIFRYPKWVRADEAPQSLAARWDGYMKNLIMHENGHRDMAVEAAAEFSRAVAEMAANSCDDLDRNVKALSREMMSKLNASSREYDSTTVHGRTQGAVFP